MKLVFCICVGLFLMGCAGEATPTAAFVPGGTATTMPSRGVTRTSAATQTTAATRRPTLNVVGTGGAVEYVFGDPKPNGEKRITGPFGVLKLTLHPKGYTWECISIMPLLFKEGGEGGCH